MQWSDLPRHPSARTLRQFAGIWIVFFLGWAAYQGWVRHRPSWGIALAVLALAVGLPGWVRPTLLRPIFVGWMILAFPIGWVVSKLLLLVLYFIVLTPVAVLFRLMGRDLLKRRLDSGHSSYWITKEQPRDIRRYLRQY